MLVTLRRNFPLITWILLSVQGFTGHTYPGATAPFGAVQLSPDTRVGNWDACAGYHYNDTTLRGFSHTHLSGTGCIDLGDILFSSYHPRTKLYK